MRIMEDYSENSENPKRLHNVPLHVCEGCGKCNYRDMSVDELIKQCVRHPDRLKKGVYARPEVLEALEEEANLER